MKLIAVSGFSFVFSDPTVQGTVILTGTSSSKVKLQGAGVCKNGFTATITNITRSSVGATIPDPGPYNVTFSATATKVKADSTLVLRVDDVTETVTATPKIPGSPPTPSPVSFHLTISGAGQTKGIAN